MLKQTAGVIAAILLSIVSLQAQSGEAPFLTFEKAVKEERGGWIGNKERLSKIFDAERQRLGDRFESELLKWLGTDPERHYWISFFLEEESYLHGSKRLPEFSLLVKQQGLSLVQNKNDELSRGYVVGLCITAAILSDELGFSALAASYKGEAEALIFRYPALAAFVPAVSESERRRYDEIKATIVHRVPVVIGDSNAPLPAPVFGGIINGRATSLAKPAYPAAARMSGASGAVQVRIVYDETGTVVWAKALSGHPDLRQAAEEAAWRSKFEPTILEGKPVKVSGTLIYNFVRR